MQVAIQSTCATVTGLFSFRLVKFESIWQFPVSLFDNIFAISILPILRADSDWILNFEILFKIKLHNLNFVGLYDRILYSNSLSCQKYILLHQSSP